jgi:hypothetical protein
MTPARSTTKCPNCGFENDLAAKLCASLPDAEYKEGCGSYLKSELECLRSLDVRSTALMRVLNEANAYLKTIKSIAIWFLVLSMLGLLLGFMAGTGGVSLDCQRVCVKCILPLT